MYRDGVIRKDQYSIHECTTYLVLSINSFPLKYMNENLDKYVNNIRSAF